MTVTEHFVRPDVRNFLDQMQANPRPAFNAELIAMIRTLPPNAIPSMDLPIGELGEVRNLSMPGPVADIALRLFDVRAKRAPSPVIVFFHGGGFVVGSIDTHASLAAEISRQLDLPVVSVEYRLAPEHPWPAAPDDAEAAARWIAGHAEAFDRTFTGLVLCGDSAGGTLTLVTSLALRDQPAVLPVLLQAAIYPRADTSQELESARLFRDGYGLSGHDLTYFEQAHRADPTHWRTSPGLADQRGTPPTLVITASLDPLRDDGRAYAARRIAAGLATTFREFEGTIHGFCSYRKSIPSARADLAVILATFSAMLQEAMRSRA